jgi:hypothetical protein
VEFWENTPKKQVSIGANVLENRALVKESVRVMHFVPQRFDDRITRNQQKYRLLISFLVALKKTTPIDYPG